MGTGKSNQDCAMDYAQFRPSQETISNKSKNVLHYLCISGKSHLHSYFLSLVIEASLHETKGMQSLQIAEGTHIKQLSLQNISQLSRATESIRLAQKQ